MAKKTVFTGIINGETFDNVQAYNARMNELVEAGVENISASSSTEIKVVDDKSEYTTTTTLDQLDEDVSLFPYMCEDDPFYLDLLVTEDPVTNQEAYTEAQKMLDKSYKYIKNVTEDMCNCERKEYLSEVGEVLEDLKADIRDNNAAIDNIIAKKVKLTDEFDAAIRKLDEELKLLKSADKVIDMFSSFYENVQSDVITLIKDNQDEVCNCNDKSKYNDVKVNNKPVETTCKQTKEQLVSDFNTLIDKIFGDIGGLCRK